MKKDSPHHRMNLSNTLHKYTEFFGQYVEIDLISFSVWAEIMITFPLIAIL